MSRSDERGPHTLDRAADFSVRDLYTRHMLLFRLYQILAHEDQVRHGYNVAFGGLFALAFALAYGRMGDFDPRATAALLAALGLVVAYIVPNFKYPANPPLVVLLTFPLAWQLTRMLAALPSGPDPLKTAL